MLQTVVVFSAFIASITASASHLNIITSQSNQYFARNLNALAAPVAVAPVPVAAKIEAEPIAVAPVVAAQSSQFISRNYNALATPVVAPVIAQAASVISQTAPVIAQAAPAKIVANTVPVATGTSSQYFLRNSNLLAAPLLASNLLVNRPVVAAEEAPVVEEARVRNLSDKLVERKGERRAASQQVTRSSKLELLESSSKSEAQPQARSEPAQLRTASNVILGRNLQFVNPVSQYFVGPRVYL